MAAIKVAGVSIGLRPTPAPNGGDARLAGTER